MRRHVLTLFLLWAIRISSQSFTNGSVFNYSVGDTIVTSVTHYTGLIGGASPPNITYRVFTNKSYSANLDTVFYGIHDVSFKAGACSGCPSSISSANKNFYITNLSASVINFIIPGIQSCQQMKDTNYVNECGINEHYKYAESGLACFEPPIHEYKIIEGIGIFEYTVSLNSNPPGIGFREELISFHKTSKQCGTIGTIPNGINEWRLGTQKLNVYPNPSDGSYTIDSEKDGTLVVENILGEEVYNRSVFRGITTIDLTQQSKGVYIVKCRTENRIYTARLVKM